MEFFIGLLVTIVMAYFLVKHAKQSWYPKDKQEHVHVYTAQLRWRDKKKDTFEQVYTCKCGRVKESIVDDS